MLRVAHEKENAIDQTAAEKKKGTAMLIKLNRILRYIVLILGGLCVIFKLKEKKATEKELFGEGFQREEFDDIW